MSSRDIPLKAERPSVSSQAEPTAEPPRKRRRWPWFVGALAILLIAILAWPRSMPVELAEASIAPLEVTILEEGRTRVRNRFVVASPVRGQLRRVLLRPGDRVVAGETVLFEIEPGESEPLDPRNRAQAEARVRGAEAARAQSAATLDRARAEWRQAQRNKARAQELHTDRVISQQEFEAREIEEETLAKEARAAEFALRVAEFELEQAQAALRRGEGVEDATVVTVRSPVSGTVLRLLQESAIPVAAGREILEVGDPSDLEVELEVLSQDAVAIQSGAAMHLENWGGDRPLRAVVRRVEPAAFTKISALGVEEQRVIVLGDFRETPEVMQRLGDRFRVEGRVVVWSDPAVLQIPMGALFRRGNEWRTFVVEAGRAEERTVQVGRSNGVQAQVRSGLNVGDVVVLHPPEDLTEGQRVAAR